MQNNYYQKDAKQQEGADKGEKLSSIIIHKINGGYKETLFKKATKTRVSKNKERNHSERRFLRESRPYNGSQGCSLGEAPRLMVDPSG